MRRLRLPNLLLSLFGHQFTTLKKLEKGFVAKVALSQWGEKSTALKETDARTCGDPSRSSSTPLPPSLWEQTVNAEKQREQPTSQALSFSILKWLENSDVEQHG